MAYTDGDVDTNRTLSTSLNALVQARYSRRDTLRSGASAAALAVFGGSMLAACDDSENGSADSAPPVVEAGSSGETSSGRLVTLTGTATDDGGVAAQSFTQTGGEPVVTLSGANTGTATFIAPAVEEPTDFTFRYVASDDDLQTSEATITVTVNPPALGFAAVAKNRNDIVTVPEGYAATVLYRLGDPLTADTPDYANDGTDTDFANRAGDHNDALHYYGLTADGSGRDDSNSGRGLLVMNHENLNIQYLHPNGPTTPGGVRPEGEAIKEIEAHGLSIVEVAAGDDGWAYDQASGWNRRITPNTPMVFNGPARGSALLRTAYSANGAGGRGTINNCANGITAWGTNLTCEENWAGYFARPSSDNAARTAKEVTALGRYGVGSATGNYGWASVTASDPSNTLFRRWNATASGASAAEDFRNEPNNFGWVVEIDPFDPESTPRKRTALGRMGHEGAWPSLFVDGVRPAWYMGDDSRREYLYKFVSATPWDMTDAQATNRLAIGDKYLDDGTLYVARFDEDGSGEWLPLVFGTAPLTGANAAYPFADQADVLIHARLAADAIGATPMDRPEWTATNPATGEMYLTLTNNNAAGRPVDGTNAANPRHYNDPKAGSDQYGNPNGHILRLREAGDSSEATRFAWDIYAFGAGRDLNPTNINLSSLDATNDFSSPDGLWFGRPQNASGQVTPVLWIQTDDGAYTDVTNCMMLAAMPGTVGDGGARTVTNMNAAGETAQQRTFIGAAPGASMRRFLVGPIECEITGVDSTPDGRTLFVNIQHPGEGGEANAPTSNWPASQDGSPPSTTRPRSATVVVTKNDGGVVAL
ncbi:alkaline phosphatase PhoX [Sphingomonas japonica]